MSKKSLHDADGVAVHFQGLLLDQEVADIDEDASLNVAVVCEGFADDVELVCTRCHPQQYHLSSPCDTVDKEQRLLTTEVLELPCVVTQHELQSPIAQLRARPLL